MSGLLSQVSPGRVTTASLAALLHAAVIVALLQLLRTTNIPIPDDFSVRTIPPPAAVPREPPEIPLPPIERRPLVIPEGPQVSPVPGDGWTPSGTLVAPRLSGGLGRPPYPPASIHLGEEGSVMLALLVGADGQVQEARVERSSGFPRLDEAALQAVLGKARFVPGTEDGRPRAMWHRITITFRLDDVRGK